MLHSQRCWTEIPFAMLLLQWRNGSEYRGATPINAR